MMERIKNFFLCLWPLFMLCMVVMNFMLSCSAYKQASPREYHYYNEVTNNFPAVNVDASAVVATNAVAVSLPSGVPEPPREYSVSYDYLVVGGVPAIRYFGKYYYEGDMLSLGRVFRIFPDRVFLQNGDVLINARDSRTIDRAVIPSRSVKSLRGLK